MKTFEFVCMPNNNGFTLDGNPLSSMACTSVGDAETWAKALLLFNSTAEYVLFKRANGRKTYRFDRKYTSNS